MNLNRPSHADRVIRDIGNLDRYIRNFAIRNVPWRDETIKSWLWGLYVHENVIADSNSETSTPSLSTPSLAIESVFQKKELQLLPLEPIIGNFTIYKRSIKDPRRLVVRGFLSLCAQESAKSLSVEEIHINRSQREMPQDFMKEIWSGIIIPRERSYCMITHENIKGTPKIAIFERGASTAEGTAISMNGRSIECVENWGPGSIFQSGVYIERILDDIDYETNSLIDLVPISTLRRTHNYVIPYL